MDWNKKRLVLIVCILGPCFVFSAYLYQIFFSANENDFGPILIEETLEVERDDINYFDIKLAAEDVIKGEFEVSSRVCINFYVLNNTNFNKMLANQNFMSYISEIHVTNYEFTFIPEYAGTYFFVFDNRELADGGVCYDKIIMFKLHQE